MRERPEPPCKLKAKPVEQVQSDNQLLDEEISRVRAERWDILAKQLVELYTQKYSLNTMRLEMLAPQRRQVIHKLAFMHFSYFMGLSAGDIHAM